MNFGFQENCFRIQVFFEDWKLRCATVVPPPGFLASRPGLDKFLVPTLERARSGIFRPGFTTSSSYKMRDPLEKIKYCHCASCHRQPLLVKELLEQLQTIRLCQNVEITFLLCASISSICPSLVTNQVYCEYYLLLTSSHSFEPQHRRVLGLGSLMLLLLSQ